MVISIRRSRHEEGEEQLDELLNAVDITLKPEQIAELETPYKPHPVTGFK